MMWFILATKQATTIKLFAVNLLDPPLGHEVQELRFKLRPRPLTLFVGVEDVLGWRELRHVLIPYVANGLRKTREVVAFREAGKLRDVVQANIDNFSRS